MQLIRYRAGGGAPQVGVLDGGRVRPLPGVATMAGLLARPLTWIRGACETVLGGGTLDPGDTAGTPQVSGAAQAAGGAGGTGPDEVPLRRITVLAPVDGATEVWAAGVTYERSMHARVAESEDSADIYDKVYTAPRPELFFKSAAWRVAGPGDRVSARADSQVDVPEPELAAVLNADGDVVGYTICNDMSSRSIEGENPLYLPQAKIYLGGCAAGPGIRPAWEVADPYGLTIEMTIRRGRGSGLDRPGQHGRPAADRDRAGGVPVPRGRVPGGRGAVHRHVPGPGPAVHAAGGRRDPHLDLGDRRAGQPRGPRQGRPPRLTRRRSRTAVRVSVAGPGTARFTGRGR